MRHKISVRTSFALVQASGLHGRHILRGIDVCACGDMASSAGSVARGSGGVSGYESVGGRLCESDGVALGLGAGFAVQEAEVVKGAGEDDGLVEGGGGGVDGPLELEAGLAVQVAEVSEGFWGGVGDRGGGGGGGNGKKEGGGD